MSSASNQDDQKFANLARIHHSRLSEANATLQHNAQALKAMAASNQRMANTRDKMLSDLDEADAVLKEMEGQNTSRDSDLADALAALELLDSRERAADAYSAEDNTDEVRPPQTQPPARPSLVTDDLLDLLDELDERAPATPAIPASYVDSATADHANFARKDNWTESYLRSTRTLNVVEVDADADFARFYEQNLRYAEQHHIDLNVSLTSLLPAQTITELRQSLERDFTYRPAKCDAYDYMIAGTAGVLGGLIDIFLVGAPGSSVLGKAVDKFTYRIVKFTAKLHGWDGDDVSDAIGFLEQEYKVNYDQATTDATGGMVKLSPSDHHIKNLAHSPDVIGLIFSILDQFTNTSHFIDDGKLIAVPTDDFELKGDNLITKLFYGFVNWFMHLISDVAGSSGAVNRGSGLPIPFFNLLQLARVGPEGNQISDISISLFRQGYDLRHYAAMKVPVVFSELVIRFMAIVKGYLLPAKCGLDSPQLLLERGTSDSPEMQRMMTVGFGVFCLLDGTDALIRAKGLNIKTLLHMNLPAWVKFGQSAIKDLKNVWLAGHIDTDKLDAYLDREYRALLQDLPTATRADFVF